MREEFVLHTGFQPAQEDVREEPCSQVLPWDLSREESHGRTDVCICMVAGDQNISTKSTLPATEELRVTLHQLLPSASLCYHDNRLQPAPVVREAGFPVLEDTYL